MKDQGKTFDKILLKACIDSPNDMLVLAIDKQYNYLAFNTYHEKVMKMAYGVEIKQGMNIIKCITNEDDIIKSKANYGKAFAGESHITIEEFGEIDRQYYETRYNPIRNENNEIIGATAFSSNVTERIILIESLKSSEEKFRKAFVTSPDSININRLSDGMYVAINEGFKKIMGYVEKEVFGKTSIELNIWVDPADRVKLVKGLKENGRVENLEAAFKGKDGMIKIGLMSATLIDLNGTSHILSITRDVTDRKKIENALQQSEIRYRELIDLAPDGILLGSADGIIIGANSRMLKLTGRKLDKLVGINIEVLFSSDELSRVPFRYDLLMKGNVITNERDLLRLDGESIPIEMHTRMMPDGSYQSIFHDITERRKFEKTLKDNERFLLESQSVARLGTFVWEMTDGLWKSSKILDEIFGIDEKYERTLVGWGNIIHPKWERIMLSYVKNDVLGKNHKFDKEYLIIRQSDKQPRWVHGLAELELDAGGNPLRLIGTISDITSRKLVEEKLREQSEVLEQRVAERTAQLELANKELEAFAYSVSHDLRAPLRAIDGFSKFLIDDPDYSLNKESIRLLNLIRSNTMKMDQLISDILSLSRVSRNSLKKSRVDMVKMALSMLNEVASPEVQNKLSIIAGEMPEVYADSTYLKQVWINLISNAIKFSSKTPKPKIEFGGYTEGNFNVYFVRDNGVGFKPDYGHKLFGVFQRLHKADEFEGNGVGLAIVQRVIHRHKGKVWAEGKPGEGATFYFSLPVITKN